MTKQREDMITILFNRMLFYLGLKDWSLIQEYVTNFPKTFDKCLPRVHCCVGWWLFQSVGKYCQLDRSSALKSQWLWQMGMFFPHWDRPSVSYQCWLRKMWPGNQVVLRIILWVTAEPWCVPCFFLICGNYSCVICRLCLYSGWNARVSRCASDTSFLSCCVRGDPILQGPLSFLTASLTIHVLTVFCVGLFQRL